jgi:hypothetical protein
MVSLDLTARRQSLSRFEQLTTIDYHAAMRSRRRILVLALLVPSAAFAQAPLPEVDAAAAAQFERGLAAMTEGNLDVGCPALAESVRIAPRPGAIFTLAECEARWGRLASAYTHYDDYLARHARMTPEQQKQQKERFAIASQQQAELKPRVPQLLIDLPPGAPPAAVVKRDGLVLGAPSLGVYLPVDPGAHEIVLELEGRQTRRTLTIAAGGRTRVVLELPRRPADTSVGQQARTPAPRPPYLAYVALGLGAVGLGIGTVFGLRAMSATSTVDDHCQGVSCDHAGKLASEDAKTAALTSTVSFAAGAGAIAAGAILFWTHRAASAHASRPTTIFATAYGSGALLGARGTF